MEFYQKGFGWQTKGVVGAEYDNGAVVLFELDNGRLMSLYERKNLAWDSQVTLQTESATEFSIGYFVNSEKEVDAIMDRTKKQALRLPSQRKRHFGAVIMAISRT
jgi:hypothetical protein